MESINGTTQQRSRWPSSVPTWQTPQGLWQNSLKEKKRRASATLISASFQERKRNLSVSAGSAVTESTTPLQGERGHPAAPLHRRHQPLDSLGLPCPSGTLTLYYKLSGNCATPSVPRNYPLTLHFATSQGLEDINFLWSQANTNATSSPVK